MCFMVHFQKKIMDSNYMPLKLLRNDYSTRYDKIPVMFIKPVADFFFFFFFHQLCLSKQTTYLMQKNYNNLSNTRNVRTYKIKSLETYFNVAICLATLRKTFKTTFLIWISYVIGYIKAVIPKSLSSQLFHTDERL